MRKYLQYVSKKFEGDLVEWNAIIEETLAYDSTQVLFEAGGADE